MEPELDVRTHGLEIGLLVVVAELCQPTRELGRAARLGAHELIGANHFFDESTITEPCIADTGWVPPVVVPEVSSAASSTTPGRAARADLAHRGIFDVLGPRHDLGCRDPGELSEHWLLDLEQGSFGCDEQDRETRLADGG